MTANAVRRAVWPAAALLGVALGLLMPKPAAAIWHDFYIELWPGGASTLTCGWHSGPCYDDDSLVSSGAALDWGGSSGIAFLVKSSTGSNLFALAGTGWVSKDAQSTCDHRAHVSVYDNNGGWRATATYLHTSSSFTNHSINISTSRYGLVSTTEPLGTTANESGCGSSWSGHHVHQIADGGWTLRSYPDHRTCNRPTITTDCWVGSGYKQGDIAWSQWVP